MQSDLVQPPLAQSPSPPDDPSGPSESAAALHIVLIDQDNVRASLGWPSAKPFRERLLRTYALDAQHRDTVLVIHVDERRHKHPPPSGGVRAYVLGSRAATSFAGAHFRADDLIARDCEWWGARPDVASVLIVSSDKLVRRRCNEVKSRIAGLRLRFETGEAFALLLPADRGGTAAEHPPHQASAESAGAARGTAACTTAVEQYVAWVEREKPGPLKLASDVALAGEKSRQGTKRKLGVRR